MITSIKEFKEQIIEYKIIDDLLDNDRLSIIAYIGNVSNTIGFITSEILYNAYENEFTLDFEEKDYAKYFSDDTILKIEELEVNKLYRNQGIAKELMNKYLNYVSTHTDFKDIYLNASPIGITSGTDLDQLVNFYKSYGFKILLDQVHNVLMYKNI